MNGDQMIYLLSLALQVSGALILIFYYWGNTERRVLNIIFPANSSMHREDDNTVIISKEKLRKAHEVVLLNRIAFAFSAAGYLISLFGKNEGVKPLMGLVIVMVASVLLVAVGVLASKLIAMVCNRNGRVFQYDDLCEKVESDVSSNYTKSELEEFKV